MSEEPQIRTVIRPEPTESERQAIISAMHQLWPKEPVKELSHKIVPNDSQLSSRSIIFFFLQYSFIRGKSDEYPNTFVKKRQLKLFFSILFTTCS